MDRRQNHTNKSEEDNEVFVKPSIFDLSCSLLNARKREYDSSLKKKPANYLKNRRSLFAIKTSTRW